jgi:hypothetical protein
MMRKRNKNNLAGQKQRPQLEGLGPRGRRCRQGVMSAQLRHGFAGRIAPLNSGLECDPFLKTRVLPFAAQHTKRGQDQKKRTQRHRSTEPVKVGVGGLRDSTLGLTIPSARRSRQCSDLPPAFDLIDFPQDIPASPEFLGVLTGLHMRTPSVDPLGRGFSLAAYLKWRVA